ncbi:hypothetical protein [Phyllobacterium trifolii]|nr:hypothetical protein [Phyllobacterium trifolii]
MRENASSSSQWPTPQVADINQDRGGMEYAEKKFQQSGYPNLANSAKMFQASAWLTPSANEDAAGTVDGKMQRMLTHQAKEASDLWSTPRASDGEKGSPNQSFGAGGIPLPAQAIQLGEMWTTPRATETNEAWETKRARNIRHLATSTSSSRTKGVGGPTTSMQAEALASSLPVHPIYPVGGIHSKERRSLNPLFVEWLMGWPQGWTLLAWTDFACSAMELSHWKQRMRFALSQLASPKEAPPAQLALFG